MNFKRRSTESELMDNPLLEKEKLEEALIDISKVNSLLGGNHITVNAVFDRIKRINSTTKPVVVMDVGCGDGAMLRLIANKARTTKINLRLIGLDNNQQCLEHARNLSSEFPEITYTDQDVFQLTKEMFHVDIMITTLTLHHFTNEQIITFLSKSKAIASDSLIINDLHRSKLAFYLFKVFSFFFIKGFVAKNDGLVSIQRAFTRKELISYLKSTVSENYSIVWKWAFRYRVIVNYK